MFRVHEYESAEALIQLDKLRKFYFDPIETPHIVVKGISHVLQVHTIRNRKSTLEFEDLLAKNTEIVDEEKRLLREQTVAAEMELRQELTPVKRVYAREIIGEYKDSFDTFDVETRHNIRHLEKRLAQKYERECAVSSGTKLSITFTTSFFHTIISVACTDGQQNPCRLHSSRRH